MEVAGILPDGKTLQVPSYARIYAVIPQVIRAIDRSEYGAAQHYFHQRSAEAPQV